MKEFAERGIITPTRMKTVDLNATALGLGVLQMMESAGRALAEVALRYSPGSVLILCGRGNNGGDGLVAARYLQMSAETTVIYPDCGNVTSAWTAEQALLTHAAVHLCPVRSDNDVAALAKHFSEADLIIDAMIGTGGSGELREPLRGCVDHANRAGVPIIAADLPTPGIRATLILGFHRQKVAGSEVADIGIPIEAECCVGPGDLIVLNRRPPASHKGVGGQVLVIGGGPYQGAPYLAGLAALRAGADIVRVASPVALQYPDLIHVPLPGSTICEAHLVILEEQVRRADVVVAGNGLGPSSHPVITHLAPLCRKAVFDAEALRLPLPIAEETIYTPHSGEFARINGSPAPSSFRERGRAVRAAAAAVNGTILLKGSIDLIADANRVRFNRTGSPAMTVGGTGDVLAGITGALFCRLSPFEAATVAAYVNGRAGEQAAAGRRGGLIASDMLEYIPCELFREEEDA